MNQDRVNKLSRDTYHPKYLEATQDRDLRGKVLGIVQEEKNKTNDPLAIRSAIRSRVHELLQLLFPVVDPPVKPTTSAKEMREQLENHHDHQTAHFQALWIHADRLTAETFK